MLCRQYRRSPLWPAQCMRRRHQQAAAVAASRPSSSALPLWWGTGWRKRRATLGTLPSVQRLCRCDPVSHWHSGNCIYVSLYSDASNQSRRGLSTTPPQSMHYCQCNNSTYYYSARGRASPILIVTPQQRTKTQPRLVEHVAVHQQLHLRVLVQVISSANSCITLLVVFVIVIF